MGCAASIPSFGKLVGLVGGVACTALGMTVPVIMLYSVQKRSAQAAGKPVMTTSDKILSPLILLLSFVVMTFVVITSLIRTRHRLGSESAFLGGRDRCKGAH